MNLRALVTGVTLTLGLATGCYSGPDELEDWGPEEGEVMERAINVNGQGENGFQLNGLQMNGFNLNGLQLNGFNLNGFNLNGSEIVLNLEVDGESVEARSDELLGSEFIVNVQTVVGGELVEIPTEVRLDDVTASPTESDVLYHMLSAYDNELDDWVPLCADAQNNPVGAIALEGGWDAQSGDRLEADDLVTFACRGDVLAKCVEMGYAPWREAKIKTGEETKEWVSMADHHQACTRMLRADYCGIGQPNTINGTLIDVGDKVKRYKVDGQKIKGKVQAYESEWDYEAEWGPDGAICIGDSLRTQLFEGQEGYELPSCIADIPETKKCGKLRKHWASGALIGTRFEAPM